MPGGRPFRRRQPGIRFANQRRHGRARIRISQRAVDLSRSRFTPLPGTAAEAAALRRLLPDAEVLTGREANESAVKSAHGPRLLHLATHGFFLGSNQRATSERGRLLVQTASLDSGPAVVIENPLLRSGLAFAGANQRDDGHGGDGILTALEASSLDLWEHAWPFSPRARDRSRRDEAGRRRLRLAARARDGGRREPGDEPVAGQRRRDEGPDDGVLHEAEGRRGTVRRVASSAARDASLDEAPAPLLLGELHSVGGRRTDSVSVNNRSTSQPRPGGSPDQACGEEQQGSRLRNRRNLERRSDILRSAAGGEPGGQPPESDPDVPNSEALHAADNEGDLRGRQPVVQRRPESEPTASAGLPASFPTAC